MEPGRSLRILARARRAWAAILGVYLARKRESCWDGVEARGIFGGMIALMREGGNRASRAGFMSRLLFVPQAKPAPQGKRRFQIENFKFEMALLTSRPEMQEAVRV